MAIVQARQNDLDQCVEILFTSEIGSYYYPNKELLKAELRIGIDRDKVFIQKSGRGGVSTNYDVLGLIWYQQEGMFHTFPYLHMIAVKDDCQKQGIGTELLDFFEAEVLKSGKNHIRTKVFLTVGDFNKNAESMYRRRGYNELCKIENLFRKGVIETLMTKTVIAGK